MDEVGCTLLGRNAVKDYADVRFVEFCLPGKLAKLRPTAAGLVRSAAHPANGDQHFKNVAASRDVHTYLCRSL